MLPQVFQTLKASADVRAIVGTNPPRIYRHGRAPQRAQGTPAQAYITWVLISGVPENNLSDTPPADRQSVQVDCWHPVDTGIDSLATAVRDALEVVTHVTDYENFAQDPETQMFRISISADFWGR